MVSAEVLSMKIPFDGNIKFLESNKNFVKEYTELFFPYEKDNSMYYYAILKKVK